MLLISSENLLVIFIALEMLSVPLYVLTAFNKKSRASAEAALKYFLFGSMAAAFTLFGISLLYGLSGDLQLGSIAEKLESQPIEPVCYAALAMTLAGSPSKWRRRRFISGRRTCMKARPRPIACFIASASKVAGFFMLSRIITEGFGPLHGSAAWHVVPGWVAAAVGGFGRPLDGGGQCCGPGANQRQTIAGLFRHGPWRLCLAGVLWQLAANAAGAVLLCDHVFADRARRLCGGFGGGK